MERGATLARALYTNVPEAPGELGFRKGEILTVLEIDHDGQPNWWLCTLRGQRGICPSNYLELLEDKYGLPSHQSLPRNVRGGSSSGSNKDESESTSSSSTLVDEPLQDYDVPRSCRQQIAMKAASAAAAAAAAINPLELYDVPRSSRISNNKNGVNGSSSDSLSRAKNRQSELSLSSTGSSTHLSSASSTTSSSARSSASCELNGALVGDFHVVETASRSSRRSSGSINRTTEDTESIMSGRSSEDQLYENFPLKEEESEGGTTIAVDSCSARFRDRSSVEKNSRSTTVSRTSSTTAACGGSSSVQELYDVPRSEPTSRAQSAMSMSSGLGLSIANSDSKDSLDLYDVPRNGSSFQAYVNHIEAKYDHLHGNCCRKPAALPSTTATTELQRRSSTDSQPDPNELYDVPRSSQQPPPVLARNPQKLSGSMASMSITDTAPSPPPANHANSLQRMGNHFRSVDFRRRRGFIELPGNKTMSCQQLNHHHSNQCSSSDEQLTPSSQSVLNLRNNHRTTGSSGYGSMSAINTSHSTVGDVKILPLSPRAAVTVCEKLRQEVVTSIKSVLEFVKPKWRTKDNLSDIMPDLRFSCVRLNLAVKDMVDFCSRTVSNAKKFSIEAHVDKLRRLLAPLVNGSQILQRDVDELEAYLWSPERLSRPAADSGKNTAPPDALDQLVLCAKSLQHDVTEIANFLALNSTALYRETERLNVGVAVAATATAAPEAGGPNVVSGEAGEEEEEDYDYVSLVVNGTENGGGEGKEEEDRRSPALLPSDQQLLEFYSTQIASIAPLLSQSIATFISSIQQNDPPKTFNGHLKYVILLAYKMLFAGDTIHRNISHREIKDEVESKANDLHRAVVALHEASRAAARDFPRIPPMQAIVDRVWETTAAATQLKKVIFNAACLL